MSTVKKLLPESRAGKRREPSHADYSDEISEQTMDELRRIARSKDRKDERWELIHGPAW